MSQDTRIGTEIAGYRIESPLGRGGMSVVYLATQAFPARKVALKLLAPELADEPGFRERFIRESNAAASLDHPNVIPIYGAGEEQGVLWIAMRYVEGTDLDRLINEEGALTPERTVHIVSQVASALDAAHRRGLVHRDVKPGNVLLGESDHAYLTDFGITKRREAGGEFTKTGEFLGSVDYAAPEQVRGETVDARADVYSLGCVSYECLTGRPPFPREAEVAVLYAHVNDPAPAASAKRPDLPTGVDDVLAKAMAKRPERRFATATELAGSLREALSPTGEARARPRRSRRRRAAAMASAGVALVALVVVVAASLGGGGSPGPAGHSTSAPTDGTTAVRDGFRGIVELDPRTGRIERPPIPVNFPAYYGHTRDMLAAEGSVWVADSSLPATILRIDPSTRTAGSPTPLTSQTASEIFIAASARSIWALFVPDSNGPGRVFLIDPGTGRTVRSRTISAAFIAAGPEGVWVLMDDGRLCRVEATLSWTCRGHVPGSTYGGMCLAGGAIWLYDLLEGSVERFDIATRALQSIPLHTDITAIACSDSGVWVADGASGSVIRIDPVSRPRDEPIQVGSHPTAVAVGAGATWVADRDGAVWRVDQTLHTARRIAVAHHPGLVSISVGEGGVWVIADQLVAG
jgi:serine/threonine-protein kinase